MLKKTALLANVGFPYNVLLFRCPAMSSTDNVEKGGGEDRDERERKSKMFDTVFIPASTNTAS